MGASSIWSIRPNRVWCFLHCSHASIVYVSWYLESFKEVYSHRLVNCLTKPLMIPQMTVRTRTSSSSPAWRCKVKTVHSSTSSIVFDDTVSHLEICSVQAVYLLLLCILSQKDRPVKLFFQASIIRFHVGGEGSELSSSISLWILLFASSSGGYQGVHNSTARLKIVMNQYVTSLCNDNSFSSPFCSLSKLPSHLSQQLSDLYGLHLLMVGGRLDITRIDCYRPFLYSIRSKTRATLRM